MYQVAPDAIAGVFSPKYLPFDELFTFRQYCETRFLVRILFEKQTSRFPPKNNHLVNYLLSVNSVCSSIMKKPQGLMMYRARFVIG